jgi:hypothetical protein
VPLLDSKGLAIASSARFSSKRFWSLFSLWILLFLASLLPSPATAGSADSLSIRLNLKFDRVVDLRTWDQTFAFSLAILSDTNSAILKTDFQDFKVHTEMDSTFETVKIRRTLLKKDFYQPAIFTQNEYIRFRLAHDAAKNFREAALRELQKPASQAGSEALTIEVPFKIKSKTFNKIFGGDRVRLRISGNININGGFRREGRSQVQTVTGQNSDYSFHIDQTQRFKITGEVGDKVSVDVDQNSEATFDFENALKLTYTGYEDEIIRKIEAGNISMQLAGTQLAAFSGQNKGLFGLKAELKIGALSLTTIASLEKGQKNQLTVSGGAQQQALSIDVNTPLTGRYFFLDKEYRNQYRFFQNDQLIHSFNPDRKINDPTTDFYLFKMVIGTMIPPDAITIYAIYPSDSMDTDPTFYEKTPAEVDSLIDIDQLTSRNYKKGRFIKLERNSDYYLDEYSGYIRLNQPLSVMDVIAVAYRTNQGATYGELGQLAQTDTSVLKLLRPDSPLYSDNSWPLAWRHVYSLQSNNIEKVGFSFKIVYQPPGATETESYTPPGGGDPITFLHTMGLDRTNSNGQLQPDGILDDNDAIIDYVNGEVIFPDLRPFDPLGYYIWDATNQQYVLQDTLPETYRISAIYDTNITPVTNFKFKVQSKSVNETYHLGFNVLEGSEEVTLGGRKLNKGTDYVIDYYSGTLTILNNDALAPSANLQILYESGEMFQLDKKTLMGVRAEYALWDQSFLGATMLYLNERPLQDRVKIGSEPLRNFLWDLNTHLVFKPQFLTTAVDRLPLVSTEAPSSFTVEAEYAQVHPNPNSLNNVATGDYSGVAYVDDFESIKKTTPLGIMRRQWTLASYPAGTLEGKPRGKLAWYNPFNQIEIKDIWPNRPTNSNVAQRTHVLSLQFRPAPLETALTKGPSNAPTNPSYWDSWGGVMRSLSAGYADQTKSKYVEIMLQVGRNGEPLDAITGKLHIDLGQLSEDVIPNGVLNTEDVPLTNLTVGNGWLDPGEDVGLDGIDGNDPEDHWPIPSGPISADDWGYNATVDPNAVWNINGTEGNENDEGGRIPDTEDLNGNGALEENDNFFRYTVDLSEVIPNPDSLLIHQGGNWHPSTNFLFTEPNAHKWKLYRIPLDAGTTVGTPVMTQINYARVWIEGLPDTATTSITDFHWDVSIATLEIVGNEWEAVPKVQGGDNSYERVSVEVVNTYDFPEYQPPPGVAGYRDPITNIVSQEQSLMLRINDLPKDSVGMVVHSLYESQSYLEYHKLKMFVHGGGVEAPSQQMFNDSLNPIYMYMRFGADTSYNYYEYRQRVYPGWDSRNNIEINLDELTQIKILRPNALVEYAIPIGGGDSLAVKGNPSLSQIRQYTVGLISPGRGIAADENVQIWLDELRVSEVKKNQGSKGRASADLTLADLATLHVNMEASDGYFHNINQRSNSNPANSISGSASGTLQLQKFLNPKWGFNLPVTGNFRQSNSVPYYFPNSDILVNNSNPLQVDSVKTAGLDYGVGVDISKPTPSSSKWLKYTVDKLSGGYDYGRTENSDPINLFSNSTTHSANMAYNLTFGRPTVSPFKWLGGVPLLSRYSKTKVYPLITKMNLTLSGTEYLSQSRARAGTGSFSHTFYLNKGLASGLHPFDNLTFDYNRTHKADLLRDPNNQKGLSDLLNGDLGWNDDNDVTQTVTSSYTPRLFSWMDTDARYNSSYHWTWGQNYIPSGQTVTNTTSLSGGLTLKLTQIFKPPGAHSGTPSQPTTPGQQYQPPPGQPPPPEPGQGGQEGGKDGSGPDQLMPLPDLFAQTQQPPTTPPGLQPLPGDTSRQDTTLSSPDSARIDTTVRNLLQIEKPKRRGAVSDLWYAVRYTITRLRDIRVDYTQQNQWTDPLVDGQAGIGYQLGINSHAYTRIPDALNFSQVSNRNRSDDYKVRSGLDFTKDFKISLSYNYRWSRNASNSVNGTITESQLYFFQTSGDSVKVFQIPIPEWSISWTGWEKFALFRDVAQTVTVDHSFTGQRTTAWTQQKANINKYDYTRNFSPLFGMTMTFKRGITANARLNWTETGTINIIPTPSKNRNRQTSLSLTASYAMKSGFKIPIPVWPFKNKRFKNNTTVSMNFNLSNSHTEQEAGGKFTETNFTSTWSVKPSLDYTFSNTVTGGLHFEYGKNKSNTGDSNFQEFGISVNITIRG